MDNFELHTWCNGGPLTKDVAMIFFHIVIFCLGQKKNKTSGDVFKVRILTFSLFFF